MESGLLITNIKATIDDKTIRNYLEKYGKVIHLNLLPDKFNETTKLCYVNYNSTESAKKALQETDKSTIFGDQIRVSYKKIVNTERNSLNGNAVINRNQSYGRGRGVGSAKGFLLATPAIVLHNISIQPNTRIEIELVEFQNPNDFLARPLKETCNSKQCLMDILSAINENTQSLISVKYPEINGFYLAKWIEDNNFYRAKLLEKLGDNTYKVCFVDEGTSGDIVREIVEIPLEISEFPCQFLPCSLECEVTAELIDFVVSNVSTANVSIYVTSMELNKGKYQTNLFINDVDIVELYKNQHKIDPRLNRFPNECLLGRHKINTEFTDYKVINYPQKDRDVFRIVFMDKINPTYHQGSPVTVSPISGDVLLYRQSPNSLHRCLIQSTKFNPNDKLVYSIRFMDEDRCLDVGIESLFMLSGKDLEVPAKVLKCVMGFESELLAPSRILRIIIEDYDAIKNLYAISVIAPPTPALSLSSNSKVSVVNKNVLVFLSHVESCDELYVQYADDNSIGRLEEIQSAINAPMYVVSRFRSINELKINQVVVAPYLEVNYRAIVKETSPSKSVVKVFFMDFGNSDWINFSEIIQPDTIKTVDIHGSGLAQRCKLGVTVKPAYQQKVMELLNDYCGETEVSMTTMNQTNHIFAVNFLAKKKDSFIDLLKFKNMVENDITVTTVASTSVRTLSIEEMAEKILKLEARVDKLELLMQRHK